MAERFVAPADARVFLGRLGHLDAGAVVRLRPAGAERTALWARLPWGVLVTREVAAAAPGDVTVGAEALLRAAGEPGGTLPPRRDPEWRWPLPPHQGAVLEEIPAETLHGVAQAAAGTLREVTTHGLQGRPVGVRMLREALLDHVPIVVEAQESADRVEVPQRLVQAVVRMGFLGDRGAQDDAPVRVRRAGRWVGLAARHGGAWLPPPAGPLTVRPVA